MSVKYVSVHVCDRCDAEYKQSDVKSTKLNWMFLTYGGGSSTSDDRHFCDFCTKSFKAWLAAGK